MKHYVVVLDWSDKIDGAVQILGVAHTFQEAKTIFAERVGEEKIIAKDNGYEIEEDNGAAFRAGIMGDWHHRHSELYIQEVY